MADVPVQWQAALEHHSLPVNWLFKSFPARMYHRYPHSPTLQALLTFQACMPSPLESAGKELLAAALRLTSLTGTWSSFAMHASTCICSWLTGPSTMSMALPLVWRSAVLCIKPDRCW